MVDYFKAVKTVFSDVPSFLIGIILNFIWYTILPLFFVYGYLVEVMRCTINNKNMPERLNLKNWKLSFKRGAWVLAIILILLMPFLAVSSIMATITPRSMTEIDIENPEFDMISSLEMSLTIISIFFFVAALFLLPMAIVLYASTENIRSALDLSEIILKIKSAILPYVKAWLMMIVLMTFSVFTLIIPVLGFFIFAIAGFFTLVYSSIIFAEIYRDYM